jgi:hypothetical protein
MRRAGEIDLAVADFQPGVTEWKDMFCREESLARWPHEKALQIGF